jgi:hypothetical protein
MVGEEPESQNDPDPQRRETGQPSSKSRTARQSLSLAEDRPAEMRHRAGITIHMTFVTVQDFHVLIKSILPKIIFTEAQ